MRGEVTPEEIWLAFEDEDPSVRDEALQGFLRAAHREPFHQWVAMAS